MPLKKGKFFQFPSLFLLHKSTNHFKREKAISQCFAKFKLNQFIYFSEVSINQIKQNIEIKNINIFELTAEDFRFLGNSCELDMHPL